MRDRPLRYDRQGNRVSFPRAGALIGDLFTLTPTQPQAEMMLSSGATTHRIDLL